MKLWIVLLLTIGFFACNKDNNNTKLELTVIDEHGSPASDFDVKLFGNPDDFKQGTQFLQIGKTNDKGIVTFDDLNSIKYYFTAYNGCINNNLSYTSIEPLKADYTNTLTIRVEETCNFTIVNESSNDYRVYYNDVPWYVISGNTNRIFLDEFPVTKVRVRILQLNGYIFFPTDLTYNIDGECGSYEGFNIK